MVPVEVLVCVGAAGAERDSKTVDLRGPMNRNDSVVCIKLPVPKMEVQKAAVFMETSQKMKSLLA